MKLVVAATALMAILGTVNGFVGTTTARQSLVTSRHMAEESAQAMTDYLAKSHEEKIRAIKEIETKKNAEIEALKNEIDSLKQGPSSSAITSVAAVKGSKEEIAAKLIAYQSFMAKYIVEAQEEKLRAVKAAEAAMAKKFEGNLLSAAAPAAPVLASAASSPETKLYMERNAKVSAAAAAGKSRWGQKEVERVSRTNNVGAAAIAPEEVNGSAVVKPSVASPAVVVPPEVKAADHGLRSDGSVGGLTLAERVALGASANGAAAPPMLSKQGVLYHQRNAMVAASAKAGKSRWGDMEVQKAVKLASAAPAAVAAAPEIEAADHGLRADGSVGGPSLAERVNLGAQLLGR